ncbi:MAG: GerMN domain-containing protein [Desulfobacterota bacterium]|nr:GerMN domain-containing protein [Thermodesulfobacteriota bacterium]
MAKRRKKRRWFEKLVLLFFLVGTVGVLILFFKDEFAHLLHPKPKQKRLLEETREVVLYFSDEKGEFLVGERRKIAKRGDPIEEGKELVKELIRGPRGGLLPTLPPKTRCLSLRLNEKGVASIDFDRTLLKDHPGGSSAEILTAYSIVHSLTQNFPQIKQVQILIEGKPVETIAGHLSLKHPLTAKPDLMGKQ